MKHIKPFESFLNEATKDITQLARELVEIAAGYVDVDMTPDMNRAMSIEEDDELLGFLDELETTIADEANGAEAKAFRKEAVAFLKKYGVKVNESADEAAAVNEVAGTVGNITVEKTKGGWLLKTPSATGRGMQVIALLDDQVEELIKIIS